MENQYMRRLAVYSNQKIEVNVTQLATTHVSCCPVTTQPALPLCLAMIRFVRTILMTTLTRLSVPSHVISENFAIWRNDSCTHCEIKFCLHVLQSDTYMHSEAQVADPTRCVIFLKTQNQNKNNKYGACSFLGLSLHLRQPMTFDNCQSTPHENKRDPRCRQTHFFCFTNF